MAEMFPPLSVFQPHDSEGYVIMSTGEHAGFRELEPQGNVRIFERVRKYMGDWGKVTPEELLRAVEESKIRKFDTGATRGTDQGKYEYARFLDPKVIQAYAAYMHKHRTQPDGAVRDPDNWKKGMPIQTFMDGIWRHQMDVWLIHEYGKAVRPEDGTEVNLEEALCALMFNTMAWLRELVKDRD